MNDFTMNSVIKKAQKLGSYFVTITTKDKSREDSDLNHYQFSNEFPVDDIIPSLDQCVRSMGIKPSAPVEVVKAPKIYEKRKPLKIAIITHFNRCPDSYSPGKAVKNQIKMLRQYGHEVVFFTQEGSVLDVGCEMRPVVPKFKREKNVVNQEIKQKFIDILREQLTSDFDLAITHDFYIDDCMTYREAVRECGVPIPWLHWARSGVGHAIDFSMPKSRYVYMNYADVGNFAKNINVDESQVRVVFNEKDPGVLFGWEPVTKMVNDKMRLWNKDIIQTYPICTTRMDAKGVDSIIRIFAVLKKLGHNVALIICNSNGRKRIEEINNKLDYAQSLGLVPEEDIVFTSKLANKNFPIESEMPYKAVIQLLQISNLFIFPTLAEVCSNVLLEASMNKNLLVLNEDLPSLFDFADENSVLKYPFTSLRSIHFSGRDEESLEKLAKQIVGQLKSNKADMQFRKVWKTHNFHSIYREMLEPLLYEKNGHK